MHECRKAAAVTLISPLIVAGVVAFVLRVWEYWPLSGIALVVMALAVGGFLVLPKDR